MGEELDEHILDGCPLVEGKRKINEMLCQSDTTAGPGVSFLVVCMHTFPLTSLIAEYCLDQLEDEALCEGKPPHSKSLPLNLGSLITHIHTFSLFASFIAA